MIKSIEETLNSELGVAEELIENSDRVISDRKQRGLAPRKEIKSSSVTERNTDINNDYHYARNNLYNLIERGNDTLDGILELAKEMEHPRAYEVASGLIKTLSDTTSELLNLQEKLNQVSGISDPINRKITNNNLFVGTTEDLQKLIKDNSKMDTH